MFWQSVTRRPNPLCKVARAELALAPSVPDTFHAQACQPRYKRRRHGNVARIVLPWGVGERDQAAGV